MRYYAGMLLNRQILTYKQAADMGRESGRERAGRGNAKRKIIRRRQGANKNTRERDKRGG